MEPSFFSNQNKKYILLFPLSVLIGAVIINGFGVDKLNEWGIFDARMALYSAEADYTFLNVMEYILKKRGLHFVIVFLVCFSTLREKLFYILIGWLGLTFGMIMGSLYMLYDFKGLFVFLLCMLGYVVMYGIAISVMVYISNNSHKKLSANGYGLGALMILVGIVVESAVNWRLFPYIMGIMS